MSPGIGQCKSSFHPLVLRAESGGRRGVLSFCDKCSPLCRCTQVWGLQGRIGIVPGQDPDLRAPKPRVTCLREISVQLQLQTATGRRNDRLLVRGIRLPRILSRRNRDVGLKMGAHVRLRCSFHRWFGRNRCRRMCTSAAVNDHFFLRITVHNMSKRWISAVQEVYSKL